MSNKEKEYCVYMHISPNGKKYIGITSQKPEYRWNNGKGYIGNKYFTRAIEKYGWDNFEHIIIARGLDEETAKWLEIELIREWDSANRGKGYNISLGGESTNGLCGENHHCFGRCGELHPFYGKHHTEESKDKISKALSGENSPCYGIPKSEEHKRKLSESLKGKNCGELNPMFGKCGELAPMYGKHHTEEWKQEQSERFSGNNNPMATKVIAIIDNIVFAIFDTMKEGSKYFNCNYVNISKVCNDKANYCGKYNGKPIVWRKIETVEL